MKQSEEIRNAMAKHGNSVYRLCFYMLQALTAYELTFSQKGVSGGEEDGTFSEAGVTAGEEDGTFSETGAMDGEEDGTFSEAGVTEGEKDGMFSETGTTEISSETETRMVSKAAELFQLLQTYFCAEEIMPGFQCGYRSEGLKYYVIGFEDTAGNRYRCTIDFAENEVSEILTYEAGKYDNVDFFEHLDVVFEGSAN